MAIWLWRCLMAALLLVLVVRTGPAKRGPQVQPTPAAEPEAAAPVWQAEGMEAGFENLMAYGGPEERV